MSVGHETAVCLFGEQAMRKIEEVLKMENVDELSSEDALQAIAQLVDYALDHGDPDMTSRALLWSEQLAPRLVSEQQRVLLDYYRANAWANRQSALRLDRAAVWAWDQEELQQQVFLLRRALNSPAFEELDDLHKCQILTNLANQLDTIGRFIEARELWSRALSVLPVFWMARANRGRSLMYYSHVLYDSGHAAVFALEAHKDITTSLEHIAQYPQLGDRGVQDIFSDAAREIERHFDLDVIASNYQPNKYPLAEDSAERVYREWCLHEHLFLNPLNDLGPHSIAARDVLTLPSFVTALNEHPVVVGFFNQLKQEYVSARWLYFEGITADEPHLSDLEVLQYDTLDYTALGLGVEQVKLAFRMAYSLLDKIAYFLNHYLQLGIPEKRISFRHVWREKETGPVRPEFSSSENWPFRGLYWLSKDLFEADFKGVLEPDARALHELRNHLEHKYVKVHSMMEPVRPVDLFHDNLAHAVSRDDLEQRTLRILKLARSALIYLSLGMHVEEGRRQASADTDCRIGSMPLHVMDDDFKRRW